MDLTDKSEISEYVVSHVDEAIEKSVTVKMAVALRLRTEEGVKDENIYQLALDEIDKC